MEQTYEQTYAQKVFERAKELADRLAQCQIEFDLLCGDVPQDAVSTALRHIYGAALRIAKKDFDEFFGNLGVRTILEIARMYEERGLD